MKIQTYELITQLTKNHPLPFTLAKQLAIAFRNSILEISTAFTRSVVSGFDNKQSSQINNKMTNRN